MTRAELLDFLRTAPGAEANTIADHFGINRNTASARMSGHLTAGYVVRKEVRRTVSNIPVYGYWVNDAVKPTMTRKERRETTTKERGEISELIANLSAALAQQIAAQVVVDLQGHLQRELAAVVPQAPHKPEVLTHKARLPKVGVTGLLPQQAGLISQEFCDTFDLSFWNDRNGDGIAQLKSMGIGCEAVFHHFGHAGHRTEEALKAVGAKIIRVSGGMSAMRDALTKYYVEIAA